jgi:DnaJ-class molecular chaperone
VREASIFFIEQILLHPEADSYRVLGATPQAKTQELRHNMALLLRWLHPDMDRNGERAILARRVTRAWEELKTPTRRAEHDSTAALAENRRRPHNGGRLGRKSRGKSAKLVRVPLRKNPGLLLRVLRYLLLRAPH